MQSDAVLPTQLAFPIVVWGDAYIDTFLDLALPTFLAPGNLPYCASKIRTRLVLISDAQGAERLRNAEGVKRAQQICDVEIRSSIELPTGEKLNKYHLMAMAHHDVIKELQGKDAIAGILSPDCLISDNALKFALDKILDGHAAVLAAGPRAGLRGMRRGLEGRSRDGRLALASRELVSLLCRNFHPISRSVFFSAFRFTTMPSCLYWKASEESFVARYFHLHPLLVRVRPNVQFPDQHMGTVDATLIDDAEVSLSNSFICEDSDDLVIVEVTDEAVMHIRTRFVISKSRFIHAWSKQWVNARHVTMFLDHLFRFKGDDAKLDGAVERSKHDCAPLDRKLRADLGRKN